MAQRQNENRAGPGLGRKEYISREPACLPSPDRAKVFATAHPFWNHRLSVVQMFEAVSCAQQIFREDKHATCDFMGAQARPHLCPGVHSVVRMWIAFVALMLTRGLFPPLFPPRPPETPVFRGIEFSALECNSAHQPTTPRHRSPGKTVDNHAL